MGSVIEDFAPDFLLCYKHSKHIERRSQFPVFNCYYICSTAKKCRYDKLIKFPFMKDTFVYHLSGG